VMSLLKLPGLIDAHVHLRDPGQTQKEDFFTGTYAALSGGFTFIVDMPNNIDPITTNDKLDYKIEVARKKVVCDIGFYFGSLGDNLHEFEEAATKTLGLKLYLNNTTGGYLLDVKNLRKLYQAWPSESPILLHAEEDVINVVIESLHGLDRPIHVCHMPSKYILKKIITAKKASLPVTCGVTPHHLFLANDDEKRLGVFGQMKPSLKPKSDVDYLWENFDQIDLIESDHAPHTREEKNQGAFGVPGLETTLPLLLQAQQAGRITYKEIIDKCYTSPAKLLGVTHDESTYIEIEQAEHIVSAENLKTKCGWSPFEGRKVFGKVKTVFLRGEKILENNHILAKKGSGKILSANRSS
jgi:dihydroorotase